MKLTAIDQLRGQMRSVVPEGEKYFASGEACTVFWSYIQALMLKGYWEHGLLTSRDEDLMLVKDYMDAIIRRDGLESHVDFNYYSTDQFSMALLLLLLYDRYHDDVYREAAARFFAQAEHYPRTREGSFWHKQNYPHQVWLDGIYMAQPFLVGYRQRFLTGTGSEDTLQQLRLARKNLFDENRKLYHHAYDESRSMFWCDPATGRSPNVWLRSVGWLSMALADLYTPIRQESESAAREIKELLQELKAGMMPHCREGMWYQIVDQEDRQGNYFETSGTLMLSYALQKGSRLGMLPPEAAEAGRNTLCQTIKRYLTEQDGVLQLGGICESAGLGRHPETSAMREGSFEYYVKGEQIVQNNGHGLGALFLAYNEYLM